MQKKSVLVLFLLISILIPCLVHAQILDDSTQLVYGPETTRYFVESMVLEERDTLYTLDTTLVDFQHFSLVDRYNHTLQNLGNLGTATREVYFQAPTTIGRTSGFNVYDYYFNDPETIRYYDTKSPYSKIDAVFGQSGRSRVDVDYSRNINPRWNIGADFTRMTADRQIGATGNAEDRQTFSTAYDVYTHFITADSTYRVMANISRMKHTVNESGGIFPYFIDNGQLVSTGPSGDVTEIPEDLFDYDEEDVWLSSATSSELRVNYHIYHQYKFSDFMGLFHVFDYQTQEVTFLNNINSADSLYYKHRHNGRATYIDPEFTSEANVFKAMTNMVGLKGDMGGLFYRLYYKRRDLNFFYRYFPSPGKDVESYGGFDISYLQENVGQLGFFGEYMLGGNYKLGARLTSKWLVGSIQRVRSAAPYIYNQYFGNHAEWHESFEPMVTDELKGVINVNIGPLSIHPRLSISNINRYLYFNEEARPAQAGSFSQILSPGFDFSVSFLKNLHFETSVTYTTVTGQSRDNFRIPEFFANATLYYTNFVFDDKLQLRTGLETHFRTAYYANDYDPYTRQFHLQNEFEIPQYYVTDFFINFKISSARVFLNFTNLTELIGLTDGYFTTPFYTGQRGSIDFGLNWMFYD